MEKLTEKDYYDQIKDWNFDEFQILAENYTNWDMYDVLREVTNEESRILDIGTGGGEKVILEYPDYAKEIIATDLSNEMIETAKKNLEKSGRKNITFKVMNSLKMDVPDEYFDVVTARHTPSCPEQIYKTLKPGGYLIIRGVDMYDCHSLKRVFGYGQAYNDIKPISIIDYEAVLDAGFKEVELIPIHEKEYFKSKDLLYKFLLKVPILDECSEEDDEGFKDFLLNKIDEEKLDEYISKNTYDKGILLLRRYYGIVAKK